MVAVIGVVLKRARGARDELVCGLGRCGLCVAH